MKDSLKAYYDAALNKTECSDPYFQGMWDTAMKAVRAMGDEVLTLEKEREVLGECLKTHREQKELLRNLLEKRMQGKSVLSEGMSFQDWTRQAFIALEKTK